MTMKCETCQSTLYEGRNTQHGIPGKKYDAADYHYDDYMIKMRII